VAEEGEGGGGRRRVAEGKKYHKYITVEFITKNKNVGNSKTK
jgi:hypothetical protein